MKSQKFNLLNQVTEDEVEDTDGIVLTHTSYDYDISGNVHLITTRQQNGLSTTITNYDSHGVPHTITDAYGNKTVTTCRYDYYNSLGQCVPYKEVTDPLGNITITIQDALGRVVHTSRKNTLGKIIQKQEIVYDNNGNKRLIKDFVISGQDPEREIDTLMTYDAANRLITCYQALENRNSKKLNWFTINMAKEKTLKADGVVINYTYDALGRLSTVQSSDNTISYLYHYDLNSHPFQVDDLISGNSTFRKFDKKGRMEFEELANGLSLLYEYDYSGRPIKMTLPDKSGVIYTYRSAFLESIQRFDKTNAISYFHHYDSYDLAGHLIRSTLIGKAGAIDYQHDLLGRLNSIKALKWQETNILYDKAGNIFQRQICDDKGKIPIKYTYDSLYQIKTEKGIFNCSYFTILIIIELRKMEKILL